MSVPPERVHIAPFGPERKRISQPAEYWRADRVVLVDYVGVDMFGNLRAEVCADLEEANIEYELVETDAAVETDLFSAVQVVSRVIEEHSDDLVYVNLATGSKRMAIAGMIAAMTSASATPYYVPADDAGSVIANPAEQVKEPQELPRFPMERPELQEIAIMEFIHRSDHQYEQEGGENYQTKKALYEFGELAGLQFMRDADGLGSEGKYGRLDRHIIDSLSTDGYITVEKVGTKRRVRLTETGANVRKAFEHLLDDRIVEAIDSSTHTEGR